MLLHSVCSRSLQFGECCAKKKVGRESSEKTALNPSANRAGWSAATPGIRVGKSPIKSLKAFVLSLAECKSHPSISG